MNRLLKNLCCILLIATAFAPSLAHGDEKQEFGSAFESSGLPWYDSSSGSLKQKSPPVRPETSVADRNRMPVKKSLTTQVRPNNQFNPVAGGAAAANSAGSFGTTFVYIVLGILVAILAGALVHWFLKMESRDNRGVSDSDKRKRKISDHIKHLPFEIEEQEGDFETFAEKSFHNGDYSGAVIYLFADLLVAMSESGLVRLQRGKTNRQYLNEIWDHQEIRPYYQKVMTAFEDAFFGKHDIEKSRAEECFDGRPAFHAALEKIKQKRFTEDQIIESPIMPVPGGVSIEGSS